MCAKWSGRSVYNVRKFMNWVEMLGRKDEEERGRVGRRWGGRPLMLQSMPN
jgi:hypothetical protein